MSFLQPTLYAAQHRTRPDEVAMNRSQLSKDLAATRKAGIRTAILVTVLVSGVVPAFCMMFSSGGEGLPMMQYLEKMWSIALMTWPLTIVVAMLTICRKRGYLKFGNLFMATSILIFAASVGNAIGIFGGHETSQAAAGNNSAAYQFAGDQSFGQQQPGQASPFQAASFDGYANPSAYPAANEPSSKPTGSVSGFLKACLGFFTSYYEAYGMRTFLASVLVGIFAGSTANRFIDYVPKNRQETVGLAMDIYETQNSAKSS